jgi:hypothetical protein
MNHKFSPTANIKPELIPLFVWAVTITEIYPATSRVK